MSGEGGRSRVGSLGSDPLLMRIPEIEGKKVLEPCELYAKVGEGGMGVVYQGRHLNLDIDVAIKCLKNVLAEQSPSMVTRFHREARIAASVHHQNLVHVYDISEKNGVHYLVMEYVQGETARERVTRKSRLSEREAAKILLGAASGLAEAHDQRIVHRDIKPDNILISHDGKVKVSDLGLAKALEVEPGPSLTIGVMGTPQYMAPEQWDDTNDVDTQADVWALGATLYFLLTGEHAIQPGTMQNVYKRICVDEFPDVRRLAPNVSDELVAVLQRCVRRDPNERYRSCREMVADLSTLVSLDFDRPGLDDTGSGSIRVPPILSPPPAQELGRIKVAMSDVGDTLPLPGVAKPAAPARSVSRRVLVWGATAALVLAMLGYVLFDREPGAAAVLAGVPPDSTAESQQTASETAPLVPQRVTEPGAPEGALPGEPALVAGATDPEPRPASERRAEKVEAARVPSLDSVVADRADPSEPSVPEAPAPTLALPGPSSLLVRAPVKVVATVEHATSLTVQAPAPLGSIDVPVDADGAVAFELDTTALEDGAHRVQLRVGQALLGELELIVDTSAPQVELAGLPAGPTPDASASLFVEVVDEHPGDVVLETVDGVALELEPGSAGWSSELLLEEGTNAFRVRATDRAGNVTLTPFVVEADFLPAKWIATHPPLGTVFPVGPTELALHFSEPVAVELDGGEVLSIPSADDPAVHVVELSLVLAPGEPLELVTAAVDRVGHRTPVELTLLARELPTAPSGWLGGEEFEASGFLRSLEHPSTGVRFLLVRIDGAVGTYLAETEVTRAQWAAMVSTALAADAETGDSEDVERLRVLAEDAALVAESEPELPRVGVSWHDVQLVCATLGYTLPTQRLWRQACLGGRAGDYGVPAEELARAAVFNRKNPEPVRGERLPNALGLYDMHGNVWEWSSEPFLMLGGGCSNYPDGITADALENTKAGRARDRCGLRPALVYDRDPARQR